MARENLFDPVYQKVFADTVNRENAIRTRWHREYSCQWSESSNGDDCEEDLPSPSSSAVVHKSNKEDVDVESSTPTKDASANGTRMTSDPIPVMRDVAPETRNLLYQGISCEGEGRVRYLNNRRRLDPEDKYTSPVCSSWDYGWHQAQPLARPRFGKKHIFHEDFYRFNNSHK